MKDLRRNLLVGSLLCLLALPAVVSAGQSNSLMDISADGELLACSNRDSGTVTIVDLSRHEVLREVAVGNKPEGVTFLGPTHSLAVAVYGEDKVVLLDGDSGKRQAQVKVFDEPYGVVSSSDGKRLFVTLDFPGQLLEIDVASAEVVRVLTVGPFLRGLALFPDEKRLLVTEFYTAHVHAIDITGWKKVDQWYGAVSDNLCRQITIHPNRPKAYFPHIRSKVTGMHGLGSIFPYVTIVDTQKNQGNRRKRIPMDSFLNNLVTASPWEVALSADGKQFYAIFSSTNDMFVCEVIDDDYREIGYRARLQLGNNPRAVKVAPDGSRFYVYNALDFNVVAYDTTTLKPVARIQVTENPLSEEVHEGKILFYSALQPMVGRRWISCSSCHPDGQPDGRTWHNPEGLRNTQSLAGLSWTHPVHWSADRDEVQDFEHTIRGPLMQGRGLIVGGVNSSLGDLNSGLSTHLDSLAAYTNSHKFSLSPYSKQGLSDAAGRGRDLFFSEKTACASCHGGPLYSDSAPRDADQIIRHDVGTGDDDPGEKMGPAYDTPTLLGVYRTAPYLHHGTAATLMDVLTTTNKQDRHGKTSHLKAGQLEDLVEFLKALPYQDPADEARKLGLKQVIK
jgi:DNA-binding beta-propeller fold protein YncE